MNLRNGKQIVQQKHQEYQKYQENTNISIVIQENTIQSSKYTQHEMDTVKLIKKLAIEFVKLHLQNDTVTKEEIFNEKLRILSELYYLIDYYNIHTNPKFVKFNAVYKKKAREFLHDINELLHRSSDYHLSRRDRLHARNFAKDLTAILN